MSQHTHSLMPYTVITATPLWHEWLPRLILLLSSLIPQPRRGCVLSILQPLSSAGTRTRRCPTSSFTPKRGSHAQHTHACSPPHSSCPQRCAITIISLVITLITFTTTTSSSPSITFTVHHHHLHHKEATKKHPVHTYSNKTENNCTPI